MAVPKHSGQRLRLGARTSGRRKTEVGVLSFVYTHSAATDSLDDAIVRDGLPDHWAEMLGLGVRQVNEVEEVGHVLKSRLVKNPHNTSK